MTIANKPLFIWAGGKTKLINRFYSSFLPQNKRISHYCEPFFGGGAFFIHLVSHHPLDGEIVINDINEDIMLIYREIKSNVNEFIECCESLYEKPFLEIPKSNLDERKTFFYEVRKKNAFDYLSMTTTERAAIQFFLMKTSFNGIYQINKNTNGRFGTPAGLMKQTDKVFDRDVVHWWNRTLNERDVTIKSESYEHVLSDFSNKNSEQTFIFLDPPYRGCFTSYGQTFGDEQQKHLVSFADSLEYDDSLFLANRKVSPDDVFFHSLVEQSMSLSIEEHAITYTAGRRKQESDGSFSAKKGTEILIHRAKKLLDIWG